MNTAEIAHAFVKLLKEGKDDEAGKLYWSDDIASVEAMDGPMANIKGRTAVEAKSAWWYNNHEIHSVAVEGPYPNAHQFVVKFSMDITPKGGQRMTMDEMALHTVLDGKIVDERFFYG